MPNRQREQWNRDDEQKPGAPPRTAYEPDGAEGSEKTSKTLTDPATGEPRRGPQAPNRSSSEDRR
ncbi:hypothetical protein [Phenylobacterium soli]|uniref:Uncharacterized protein n=1 Tax=Phenylobacterium soli TaxID=2170551 RepID=A0A328AJR3_9CAUL|nr:hypothetical protein [Phenylobacterium soli]RAK55050.1 hypothetical protein DJ017_11240 [Phenylobacterium soli]